MSADAPDFNLDRRKFLQSTAALASNATGINPLLSGVKAAAAALSERPALPAAFSGLKTASNAMEKFLSNGDKNELLHAFLQSVAPQLKRPEFEDNPDMFLQDHDAFLDASDHFDTTASNQLRTMLKKDPDEAVRRFVACMTNQHAQAADFYKLQQNIKQAGDALHVDLPLFYQHIRKLKNLGAAASVDKVAHIVKHRAEMDVAGFIRESDRIKAHHDRPLAAATKQLSGDMDLTGISLDKIVDLPDLRLQSAGSSVDAFAATPQQFAQYWSYEAKQCVREALPKFLSRNGMTLEDAKKLITQHRAKFDSAIDREHQRLLKNLDPATPHSLPAYIEDDQSNLRNLQGKTPWVEQIRDTTISYIAPPRR